MILQASESSSDIAGRLLDQGVVGILAILCIVAVMAMWRYADRISKRVELVTDRFLGHLEEQAKRDAVEAEGRVKAQMKVAEALESIERRVSDHDGEASRRHREIMDKLSGSR